MLLYSRTVTARGPVREVVGFATQMFEVVNESVGHELSLYVGGPGTPLTTLAFTSVFESRAEVAAGREKLFAGQRSGSGRRRPARRGCSVWVLPLGPEATAVVVDEVTPRFVDG